MANEQVLKVLLQLEDQLSRKLGGVATSLSNIGSSLTSAGRKLSLGVTLPLLAAGGASVQLASNLEESKNKVSVVFGEMSADVLQFSEDSATAFGLSQQGALDAIGTFGNLFDAMGIGKQTNVDMSESLIQLTADLASFNNMDPGLVLEKLRSGLVGETMPLRQLGVNINEALLKSKAFELGLISQGEELTAAARTQAAYALIMEQTTNAQGDFVRTSDALANSQRILKAELADAGAQIGQILLPVITDVVHFISELVSGFRGLSPETQRVILIVGGLAAALGPLLIIVGTVAGAVANLIPVFGAIAAILSGPLLVPIGIIVGALGLLWLAWQNNFLNIQGVVASLADVWNNTLFPALEKVWSFLSTYVFPLIGSLANLVRSVFGVALSIVAGIFQNILLPRVQALWDILANQLFPIVKSVADFFGKVFGPAIRSIGTAFDFVKGIIDGVADALDWVGKNLPDWMTPGSPTPLELGLRGINTEMRRLAQGALPQFGFGLRQAAPALAGGFGGGSGLAAGGGLTLVLNYSPVASFADAAEVRNKLMPMIKSGVLELVEQSRL